MRLKPYSLAGLFCVFALGLTASPFNQIVGFGDSLSDNGNAAIALGGSLPGNYAGNAATDGPFTTPATGGPLGLWIDQFASKAGVSDPQPFLAGGTNFAVATALTGHNPLFTGALNVVPFTTDQVALFLGLHLPPTNDLFTFWAGANDINSAMNPVTAADNIFSDIQTLAAAGAQQFLWLNLPLLGDTPDGIASGQSALLNAASLAFDAEWAADIAKLHASHVDVIGVDIEQLFLAIQANPGAFGFTDITDPAWCGTGGLSSCATNDPNKFLFWDGEHPTTAADSLIADLAFKDLTAVPEPSSLALVFGALCMAALTEVKRRRGIR